MSAEFVLRALGVEREDEALPAEPVQDAPLQIRLSNRVRDGAGPGVIRAAATASRRRVDWAAGPVTGSRPAPEGIGSGVAAVLACRAGSRVPRLDWPPRHSSALRRRRRPARRRPCASAPPGDGTPRAAGASGAGACLTSRTAAAGTRDTPRDRDDGCEVHRRHGDSRHREPGAYGRRRRGASSSSDSSRRRSAEPRLAIVESTALSSRTFHSATLIEAPRQRRALWRFAAARSSQHNSMANRSRAAATRLSGCRHPSARTAAAIISQAASRRTTCAASCAKRTSSSFGSSTNARTGTQISRANAMVRARAAAR